MNCIFDKCELINGLFLGLISSGVVAFLTYLIINRKIKKQLLIKYGKAVGEYDGFSFEEVVKNKPESGYKKVLKNEAVSKANVIYLHDNILKITLTEINNNHIWEGYITMELENLGSIAWEYKNLENLENKKQYSFGLKRCIINDDIESGFKYIYLIGEKDECYGKEILIQNVNKK